MVLRLSFWRKEAQYTSTEPHKRPGQLSDFILGSQDGIVNVLGVILGVAVASQEFTIILAGGLAATFAESISMAAVAYTSTLARRDHYLSEAAREKKEMEEVPEQEKMEVREILKRWGFEGPELEDIPERVIKKPKAMLELMMAHELFLSPVEEGQALRSALLVGIAAIVGSLIPLSPFIIMQSEILSGIIGSLVVSALFLFMIGWYKAKTTVGRPGRSGLEMLVIGIASALAGFAVAFLVSGGKGL
jgi:VIT1/CCC1 family predicted Fe2+/Mn2+ transporter